MLHNCAISKYFDGTGVLFWYIIIIGKGQCSSYIIFRHLFIIINNYISNILLGKAFIKLKINFIILIHVLSMNSFVHILGFDVWLCNGWNWGMYAIDSSISASIELQNCTVTAIGWILVGQTRFKDSGKIFNLIIINYTGQ